MNRHPLKTHRSAHVSSRSGSDPDASGALIPAARKELVCVKRWGPWGRIIGRAFSRASLLHLTCCCNDGIIYGTCRSMMLQSPCPFRAVVWASTKSTDIALGCRRVASHSHTLEAGQIQFYVPWRAKQPTKGIKMHSLVQDYVMLRIVSAWRSVVPDLMVKGIAQKKTVFKTFIQLSQAHSGQVMYTEHNSRVT